MAEKEEQIRRRAYEIWEKLGRPERQEELHWTYAEREIEAEFGTPEGAKPTEASENPGGPAPEAARPGTGAPSTGDAAPKA